MPYSPTVYVNGTTPAINATNLNKLKTELASQAAAKSIAHTLPTWVNGTIPAVSDPVPLNEMERVARAVSLTLPVTAYVVTTWQSGWVPARNAANLNKLEAAAQTNRAALDSPGITPVLVVDFETGDFSQSPTMSQQESSAGRISLVNGITWGGNWTAKTLIGPPDQGVAGSGGSYRTEMAVAVLVDYFGGSLQGKNTWLTWDQFLDPNFELSNDPNSWLLWMQLWTTGLETGSPCFAVTALQGQMYITLRGGDAFGTNTRVLPIGAVPLNQLLRWKVHHRWAGGSGGLIEVWRNGVKLVNGDTQPNMAPGNDGAVEFKTGTYRSGSDPPQRDSYTLVDNIKFWTADPGAGF